MDTLRKYFQKNANVELAYLFGSRATGKSSPTSDYDIGIKLKQLIGLDEKYFIEVDLRNLLNTHSLDLIIMNEAPLVLNYNIIKGKCIYAVDRQTRIEIEANILSRYFDYLPVLREHCSDILRTARDEQQVQRNRIAFAKTEKLLAEIRTVENENA